MRQLARQHPDRQPRQQGFTLVELMVVLSIAAILFSIAVPNFNEMVERNRREGVMTDFSATIQTARSEAARSNKSVIMCASTDGAQCNSTNWANGWILFTDKNNNQQFDTGATNDGDILESVRKLATGYTITPTTGEFTSWIQFRSTGEVLGNNGGSSGRFRICSIDADPTHAKYLALSAVGQLRLDKMNGDTCP